MFERRNGTAPAPSSAGALPRRAADLEAFEREYTLERFNQRELMISMGAALWLLTMIAALAAIPLSTQEGAELPRTLPAIMALISLVVVGVSLFLVRPLDDRRTGIAVTALTILMSAVHFGLSFYGAGALGALFLGQVTVAVYAAQFLSARRVAIVMSAQTVFAALNVHTHYGDPQTPNLLSQISLLQVVLWTVAYSVYILKQDRASALRKAESTAFSDPLTGLPNIRMLRRRAEALLEGRNERIHGRTGIIVIDIDGFRAANIAGGRRDGDRLLIAVADAIRAVCPPDEMIARTGSDEFSVLVSGATQKSLKLHAERCRQAALAALNRSGRGAMTVSASTGTAITNGDGQTLDDLLRTADRAMYLQKAARPAAQARRETYDPTPTTTEGDRETTAGSRATGNVTMDRLRWANRPVQTRFLSVAWLLSGCAVWISMRMPDAIEHNVALVNGLVLFAIFASIVFYLRPPALTFPLQLLDVLVATVTLSVTVYATGKGASPAVPIELLILIYIGWFLPRPSVVPLSLLSMTMLFSTLLLWPAPAPQTADLVGINGGFVLVFALITVLYLDRRSIDRADELTAQLASLDPRAGAYNRRAFEQRLADELDLLSYGDRDALAVVMLDLGNFPRVGAEHGREAGDRILTDTAAALAGASREEDCVARLGGDEFGVVAPGVDAESARALAQRLTGAVRKMLEHAELDVQEYLRPSAGFALYGMHGRTVDELLAAADIALTAAKTSGRDPNRVSSFVVGL